MVQEMKVQCPCGQVIDSPAGYKLLFLKKELLEIDILCPNDTCYMSGGGGIGCIRFKFDGKEAKFSYATFYPPFVTWNSNRLGSENTQKVLKEHLVYLAKHRIDWNSIKEDLLKKEVEKKVREEEVRKRAEIIAKEEELTKKTIA